MKYIKKFTSETAYELESDEFKFPTVSYVKKEDDVKYIKFHNYKQDYLTFEALEDCVFTISSLSQYGNPTMTKSMRESFSYSIDDGETWVTYTTPNEGITATGTTALLTTPTIHAGEKVLWKGIGTQNYTYYEHYNKFTSTGNFKAYGNAMTLLYGDNGLTATSLDGTSSAFGNLFNDCTKLISACDIVLPATTLVENCYRYMFDGCTALIDTPKLPATTLAPNCYLLMFGYCTSLTTPPRLPAITLAEGCYNSMFSGCTALRYAPVLHAEGLIIGCYKEMFLGCTNLNYIKAMFTTFPNATYNLNWVNGVAPKGVFVKNHEATWDVVGYEGIPNGWAIKLDNGQEMYYYNDEGVGSFDII